MPITDKTRKVLWGRSGNLCAICRQKLVADETELDDESVVGDECHILSGAPNGPRHDPSMPIDKVDDVANLMLLCKVHHKMVDDLYETYTVVLLRSIKANHERWVETKLRDDPAHTVPPVRIRRIKDEIPEKLMRVTSGKDLFTMASGCAGYYQDHSDDLSEDEVELVGGFLQNIRDWGDLGPELEPIEQVRAKKAIDDELRELEARGFYVFAAVERQRIEGGVGTPSYWNVLHVAVMRSNDPNVVAGPASGS